MTWFKVDDGFADHPKVDALLEGKYGEAALALWTLAGVWSAKHLQNGKVPAARVRKLGIKRAELAAAELVRVGLWHPTDDGFVFHQWDEHQPTREKVLAERARKAGNKRDSRARATATEGGTAPVSHRLVTASVTGDRKVGHRVPSRPVPSRPLTTFAERARQMATTATTSNGGVAHRDTKHFDHANWVELARFAIEKAAAIEATPEAVLAHTIGAWAQSKKAKESGWCSAYLAQNPEEWFQLGARAA